MTFDNKVCKIFRVENDIYLLTSVIQSAYSAFDYIINTDKPPLCAKGEKWERNYSYRKNLPLLLLLGAY